jgi:UDP-N-acetylglucosamine--N-acetylmuramyl-(pentapeptide) pyrophosphoryl-undecaprenol N-acetylglucosamine transferase
MRVALAAAGTAGHIEPALALARWLQADDPSIHCEFIGTSAGLDTSILQSSGFTLHPVTKAPFPRRSTLTALAWPFKFARAISQISRALKGCDLVVGFGGYVCAPTYLVARAKKIPIVIHEANAKPGMANNLGRALGAHLTVAFESTGLRDSKWGKAEIVGMPLRSSIIEGAQLSLEARNQIRIKKANDWGFDPKRPIVVVFGGSQGSQAINAVIGEILPHTARIGIQILHAVGAGNRLPARSENYLPLHYIADMADTLLAADLSISRAGAVTCAEIGVLGTFGVIVPLAIGNGEQSFNALELSDRGAAIVLDQTQLTTRHLSQNLISYVKQAQQYRATTHAPLFPIDAPAKLGGIVKSQRNHGRQR